MRCTVVLSFLLFVPGVLGCLWDRDTLAAEGKGRGDVVKVIVGWFDRFPPEFYEHRLKRVTAELQTNPDQLSLYDDAAVACDRLGRPGEAIAWMEKKAAKLHLEPADAPQPNHRYRYLANLGTFHAHRWIRQPAEERPANLEDLETAQRLVAQAIEENPEAHFGREKYQLEVIDWLLADEPRAEEMLLDQFGHGIKAVAIRSDIAMSELEQAGRDDASEGLAGMIRLGAGWRTVDLFTMLAGTLKAEGRNSLALLAGQRVAELRKSGNTSLHPVASVDGTEFDVGSLVSDRDSVVDYFVEARAAADERQERLSAYITVRLAKGEHPDTNDDFWNDWKEPRFPRLPNNWFSASKLDGLSPLHKAALFGAPVLIVLLCAIQVCQRRRSARQKLVED